MALRPTTLLPEAELTFKENRERIKLQARQITNRVMNRVLAEHDKEFIERYTARGEVMEIGTVARSEIEDLFKKATVLELEEAE